MNRYQVLLVTAAASFIAACSSTPSKPAAPAPAPKAAAAPAPAAAAVNLAGNWVLTIDSQMGSQDSKLALTQNGKELKGKLDSPQGAADVDGKLEGKDVNFGFNFSGQGVELRIDFIGTTDGQTMSGRAVFGSYGEGTFKAKRQ